jgi:hypothetical protein
LKFAGFLTSGVLAELSLQRMPVLAERYLRNLSSLIPNDKIRGASQGY